MSAWRFSLFGLLAAVTFAATACGALVNPNEWWAMGVTTAAVALLAYAVLAAIYRQAARRAFWLGLAVIGWGFFVLPGFAVGFKFENYGQLPLASSKILQMLGEAGLTTPAQLIVGQGVNSNAILTGYAVVDITGTFTAGSGTTHIAAGSAADETWSHFYTIGHCLWSLFLGIAAGLVARRLFLAREQALRTLLRRADRRVDVA